MKVLGTMRDYEPYIKDEDLKQFVDRLRAVLGMDSLYSKSEINCRWHSLKKRRRDAESSGKRSVGSRSVTKKDAST